MATATTVTTPILGQTGSVFTLTTLAFILLASVLAALLASLVLVPRNRRYRRATEAERRDADADGIPDAFDAAPHDPTISEERAG